jgi:hypothetical protein
MYKPFGAKQNLAALLGERGKILEVTKEIQILLTLKKSNKANTYPI